MAYHPSVIMTDCMHCGTRNVVKAGKRRYKFIQVQQYKCKDCGKRFVRKSKFFRFRSYTAKIVIKAITFYNQGYSLREVVRLLLAKYGVKPSFSSIRNWLIDYSKYHRAYRRKGVIKSKRFRQGGFYDYKYHDMKLSLVKYDRLKEYLQNMECPISIFDTAKQRCSKIKINSRLAPKNILSSNTLRTEFALSQSHAGFERHPIVLDYLLINDPSTIAD